VAVVVGSRCFLRLFPLAMLLSLSLCSIDLAG